MVELEGLEPSSPYLGGGKMVYDEEISSTENVEGKIIEHKYSLDYWSSYESTHAEATYSYTYTEFLPGDSESDNFRVLEIQSKMHISISKSVGYKKLEYSDENITYDVLQESSPFIGPTFGVLGSLSESLAIESSPLALKTRAGKIVNMPTKSSYNRFLGTGKYSKVPKFTGASLGLKSFGTALSYAGSGLTVYSLYTDTRSLLNGSIDPYRYGLRTRSNLVSFFPYFGPPLSIGGYMLEKGTDVYGRALGTLEYGFKKNPFGTINWITTKLGGTPSNYRIK